MAVFQDVTGDGKVLAEFLKNGCLGGIPGFAASVRWQLQLVEKYATQLLGRIDIKLISRLAVNTLFQYAYLLTEVPRHNIEDIFIQQYAVFLHIQQYRHQRHLYLGKKLHQVLFLQLRFKYFSQSVSHISISAGIISRLPDTNLRH